MPKEEINTPNDPSTDPSLSPSGDGEGADKSPKDVSLKDELGKALGKEFPTDDAALKSVKDTFSFVGEIGNIKELKSAMGQLQKTFDTDQKGVLNKMDEIVKTGGTGKIDPSKFVNKGDFDRSNFYLNKPEYKPYSSLVETYQKANPDKSREEIIETDDFKEAFGKIKAHDETEKTKSVLGSNPRLGKVTDKISEAKEAQSKGNQPEAEEKAVDAVIEAYPVEPKK